MQIQTLEAITFYQCEPRYKHMLMWERVRSGRKYTQTATKQQNSTICSCNSSKSPQNNSIISAPKPGQPSSSTEADKFRSAVSTSSVFCGFSFYAIRESFLSFFYCITGTFTLLRNTAASLLQLHSCILNGVSYTYFRDTNSVMSFPLCVSTITGTQIPAGSV